MDVLHNAYRTDGYFLTNFVEIQYLDTLHDIRMILKGDRKLVTCHLCILN